MIRVVIIDDEKPALDELSYQLGKYEQIKIIAQFTDSLTALKEMETLDFDAVFLDIDMPILGGLSLASELLEQNRCLPIIFVTAYNDYALQAFEVNAVDYIVKPVRPLRLKQAVEKLQNNIVNYRHSNELLMDTLKELKKAMSKDADKLIVFDGKEYNFIRLDEIMYVEAQAKIISVVTAGGVFTARKTMSVMEEQLQNGGLFRCHRSYIINPKHIMKIIPSSNGAFLIQMNHSPIIPVSKPYAMKVRQLIECGKI